MDRKVFADPGLEYRGVTLWMLNDKLERDEIAKQVRDYYEAGWGALITRTFNGLRTPYLSEEWMAIIEEILARARGYGIKVWLQAGYMPSGIPDLPPEHTHKVLVRKAKGEAPEEGEVLVRQEGDYAYYRRPFAHVLDLLSQEAVEAYLRMAYEEPWWERFGNEFGKTVETVWVDEPHFRPPLLPWNDELPKVFAAQWGYPLEEHVAALYAPVGDYQQVRHHYWRTVVDMFMGAYFAGVSRWCAAHRVKFGGHAMGEDSLYRQICWTGAAMRCYEYMHLPGIDHLTLSLTWPNGNKFIYTPKQCASVANQLGWKEILAEMYGVSSQRISFEERKMLGEWLMLLGINYRCYHGSFYSMRGVRKRIYTPHLSYQQPWWPDNRLIADYFARLSYVLRQGQYRADALIVHPVESAFCVFDPHYREESERREAGKPPRRPLGPPPMEALNQSLQMASENLLEIHRGFEYGDEHLIGRYGKVVADGLAVGEMTYPVVILPSVITLRRSTVDLLNAFLDEGGTVLAVGDLPTRVDGREEEAIHAFNRRLRRVANTRQALKAAMDELVPSSIEVVGHSDGPDIWVHERRLDGARAFFLANTARVEGLKTGQDESVEAEVRIRGRGKLEEWDLRMGEVKLIPQRKEGEFIVTRLPFPAVGSHLLVLQEKEAPVEIPTRERTVVCTKDLPSSYRIRRHDPNALTLDFCRYRQGEGAWSEPLPVIAVQEILEDEGYVGPVALQFHFRVEDKPRDIRLVVEDAEEYEIKVNGQAVAYTGLPYYMDRSFHPVNITPQVQLGENVIELARHFKPTATAAFHLGSLFITHTGVELESIYLIGDFAVRGERSPRKAKCRCVRLVGDFALTQEEEACDGDLVAAGYPFFAGRLSLVSTVQLELPAPGEKVFLTLPNLDLPLAKVKVNRQEAGAVIWQPYQVEITPLVRDGENTVEIELVTSLRNLLGPHHRRDGERDDTWGNPHFSGRASAGRDWYMRREDESVDWTDDYFVMEWGLQGPVSITYVRE